MYEYEYDNDYQYDIKRTTHDINGVQTTIFYLGAAEWNIDGKICLFVGSKDELIRSLKREPLKSASQ